MKKGLLLFFMLLVLPAAYASISVDGPDKSIYNLGDDVSISGYIITNVQFDGFVSTALDCSGIKFNLPSTVISLNANEKKSLETDIQLPKLTIPNSVSPGNCVVELSLVSGSAIIDSARSNEFAVKKDLKGDFSIDRSKLQVGKTFKLTGNVYQLDGSNANGAAEIYFKDNNTRFLVDVADIKDGKINYEYKVLQIPEGAYSIDLFATDIHGNQMLFENVAEFTVVSRLSILAKASETIVKPGSSIKVYGDVKSSLDNAVLTGTVKIKIDDNEYSAQIKNNKFEYSITLSSSIKSGEHSITLLAEDRDGNSGNAKLSISVTPIEKELKMSLNTNEILPKETLEITPLLYDQADELIKEPVSIEVYDIKNKLAFSDSVRAGMISKFAVPINSLPGSYTIKLGSSKLRAKATFQVGTTTDLIISLANQSIIIENIGNIKFEMPIKIVLNPNQITIVKKLSLRPEKSVHIDLADEITASGIYDITVSYNDKIKAFKNISLEASEKIALDLPYYLTAIAFFAVFIYLLYIKVLSNRKAKHREEHEKAHAQKELKRLRELKGKGHSSRFSYGNANRHKAIEDFKHSYVEKVKEPETRAGMFDFMDRK